MKRAEEMWKAGDFVGVWEATEELEPIDRVMPETLDLRLRVCIALERWKMGEDISEVLSCADDRVHRITCAEYCVARAKHHAGLYDGDEVKRWCAAALRSWPDIASQIGEGDELVDFL